MNSDLTRYLRIFHPMLWSSTFLDKMFHKDLMSVSIQSLVFQDNMICSIAGMSPVCGGGAWGMETQPHQMFPWRWPCPVISFTGCLIFVPCLDLVAIFFCEILNRINLLEFHVFFSGQICYSLLSWVLVNATCSGPNKWSLGLYGQKVCFFFLLDPFHSQPAMELFLTEKESVFCVHKVIYARNHPMKFPYERAATWQLAPSLFVGLCSDGTLPFLPLIFI